MKNSMIDAILNQVGNDAPQPFSGIPEQIKEFATKQYRTLVLDRIDAGESVDTLFILNDGEQSKVEYYERTSDKNFNESEKVETSYSVTDKKEISIGIDQNLLIALDFKGNFITYKLADYDLYPSMSKAEKDLELYSHSDRVWKRNFGWDRICIGNVFNQKDPVSILYPKESQ